MRDPAENRGRRLEQSRQSASKTDEIRILYVIGSLNHGGAEFHLRLITPELRSKGWKPSIYCLAQRGAQASDVEAADVEVIGPPLRTKRLPAYLHRIVQATMSGGKLFWLLLRRRPNIVHFFLPGAYLIGGPLALLARTPIRIMSRRSLDNYQARWPLLRRMELRLHKRMTAILGNSSAVVSQLIEREACQPDRVHLIHNGIDLSRYGDNALRDETRAELDITSTARVAAIVANLIPYKGHADLLRGLHLVRDRLPPNWVLLTIGRDDGALNDLQSLSEELGLAPHIRFLGLRRDVPDLLAASDVGILSSHQEGFSNALIEGMASGLPMVATNVGGNADAVIHDRTGLIVPPHDPQALGNAVADLMADEERARIMGNAGKRRADENYSLASCVGAYETLYRSLLMKG